MTMRRATLRRTAPAPLIATLIITAPITAAFTASRASAADTPEATGTALATVIAPLKVTTEADLDFGTIAVANDSPGTVAITPLAGTVAYAGGAQGVCAGACPPPHPARFAVHGEPGRAYLVTLPGQLSIMPNGGGAGGGTGAVLVDQLAASAVSTANGPRGILAIDGQDHFEVGGTLHLPARAEPARYTTQVSVIVEYM